MPTPLARVLAAALLLMALAAGPALALQQPGAPGTAGAPTFTQSVQAEADRIHPMHELYAAMIRLPVAALLGTALALRPRRRGTPKRDPAVVQTQIVLAVVGAVIMLVVGASLARAFGIVGAANLIRYRSKIDDPKDAVVMLCTLSVGLASGVGLYTLTVFSTVFLVALLWIIESFEPKSLKRFALTVKAGKDTDGLRPKIEAILTRHKIEFDLSKSSDEEVCYDVQVAFDVQTDRISNDILRLDPDGHGAVEWADKKTKAK